MRFEDHLFKANVPILYYLKTPEKQRYKGGVNWGHWLDMG